MVCAKPGRAGGEGAGSPSLCARCRRRVLAGRRTGFREAGGSGQSPGLSPGARRRLHCVSSHDPRALVALDTRLRCRRPGELFLCLRMS